MYACLCSAYMVKSSVFWTARALLSLLKCYSAHRVEPDARHTGVDAPSLNSIRALAQGVSVLWSEPLPQASPQMAWNPGGLPQTTFLMLGIKFLAGKKGTVGAAGVVAVRNARGLTVQNSTGSKIKPQLHLSSEDAERSLWIAFS